MSKIIEVWELKTLAAQNPSAFIAAYENPGGGAQLFGTFETREAAQVKSNEFEQDGFVYSVTDAISEFCED